MKPQFRNPKKWTKEEMDMTKESEISKLIGVLKSKGYKVEKGGCPRELNNWCIPEEYRDYWFFFYNSPSICRSEGKGGFLVVKDTQEVSYDFFKGGFKNGSHLKTPYELVREWTTEPFLEKVLTFLEVKH